MGKIYYQNKFISINNSRIKLIVSRFKQQSKIVQDMIIKFYQDTNESFMSKYLQDNK